MQQVSKVFMLAESTFLTMWTAGINIVTGAKSA